jgi:hypothetical protein
VLLNSERGKQVATTQEHKAAILELLGRYSGAAGRKDSAEMTSYFTADCEVVGIAELGGAKGALKGRKQVAEFMDMCWAGIGWCQQINTTTDIDLDDSGPTLTAKAITNLVETAQRTSGTGGILMLIGRYHDDLVLTGEGWRFRRRRMEAFHFKDFQL